MKPRNNLKRLRKIQGVSQRELASAAGVSRAAVSLIEIGERYGLPATRHALARALGVHYSMVFPPEMDEAHAALEAEAAAA